jgi:hypothetical protein
MILFQFYANFWFRDRKIVYYATLGLFGFIVKEIHRFSGA